jgi:hypothetical protein
VTVEDRYTTSMYWAFVTLSTVGYGDIYPRTMDEKYYAMASTYIGCLLFAFVIGELTLLANSDSASFIALRKRMESLEEFMRFYKFPRMTRQRVRAHFDRCWEKGVHFREEDILCELPAALRRQATLLLRKDLVCKSFLLNAADAELAVAITEVLRVVSFKGGEFILTAGDEGREMMIVMKGEVEAVVTARGGGPVSPGAGAGPAAADGSRDDAAKSIGCIMSEGSIFGEIALLSAEATMRAASVIALGNCECGVISQVLQSCGISSPRRHCSVVLV